MALAKTPATIIAVSTSNSAGSTTHGTIDLRADYGGILTVKVANGSVPPTAPAVVNILIAHDSGTTPAAAAAGSVWKTITSWAGGTTANAVSEWSMIIDPAICHLEVEVTSNTGQAVTCEAIITRITGL